MTKEKKRYWVDWYRDGFCYRSTANVDWDGVRRMKRVAKALGETIKYSVM